MLRKFLCASLVFVLCVAITKAEEIRAIIYKVDTDKKTITYKLAPMKKGDEVGKDEVTVKFDDKISVVKGKFDPDTKKLVDGDPIENGLKADMFTKIDEKKGVRVTLTTSGTGADTMVTKIVAGGGMKKNKN
jgi:hypothetical protein